MNNLLGLHLIHLELEDQYKSSKKDDCQLYYVCPLFACGEEGFVLCEGYSVLD